MRRAFFSGFKTWLPFAGVFAWYCLITFPLLPLGDDWNYHTMPNVAFRWANLLPRGAVWRPLDILFGGFLGLAPGMFPWVNRLAVAAGHTLGGFFLCRVLQRLYGLSRGETLLPAAFFLFAAGGFTAVASVDGLNQVYASTFGIMAFDRYLAYRGNGRRIQYALFVALCFLAALSKENGLVWFAVIPFLAAFGCAAAGPRTRREWVSAAKGVCAGIGFVLLYLAVRVLLAGEVTLGASDGPYRISLSAVTGVRFLTLLAGGFTSVDTIAWFVPPRNALLFGVTVMLSAPLLLWLAGCGVRALRGRETRIGFGAVLLALFAMAVPNSLTTVGEMHAYAVLFFAALLIAQGIRYRLCGARSGMGAVFLAWACATLLASAHKWVCLYRQGQEAEVVNRAITEAYKGKKPPDHVLIVKVMDEPAGYSLFAQPVAYSSYYGYSARALWNWRHPARIRDVAVRSLAEKDEAIAKALREDGGYDAVWVVRANGEFRDLTQRR